MKQPIEVFGYHIVNKANNEVDVHIDGEIVDASTQAMLERWFGDTTSTSYRSFRNQLDALDATTINVIVNSPGGHVGDALAIYDYLVDLQNKGTVVNTKGRGIVASSGTLILMAGKNPEMSENTMWLMHDASSAFYGNVEDMENHVKALRKFNNKIRDLYAQVSGQRIEDVAKLMKGEGTWLTAQEALDKGFIKSVSGREQFENKIEAEKWPFANTTILNVYNSSVKQPEPANHSILEDMKKLFTNLQTNVMAAIKGVKVENGADNQALVNSIATAAGSAFSDTVATEMEGEVNTLISNFFNTEAGKKVITDAVAAKPAEATTTEKPVVTMEALAQQVVDLQNQLEQKIGNASTAAQNTNKNELPLIGGFTTDGVAAAK
jgi:ATP-dependent Clp protease protease subunit